MEHFIINTFVGIQDIRFGLKESEIIALIGEPDEITEDEYTDNSISRVLEYVTLGLQLVLDSEDDYRLTTITVANEATTVNGVRPIGKSEEELSGLAGELGAEDLSLEDEFSDLGSKDYYSDQQGLSFWIVDGVVDSVSIFPAYEADGETIRWPD